MFFPPEASLTIKSKEKSSFKDFFRYNFQISKDFLHSFSGPSTKLPRSIPISSSIKSQSHIKFAAKTWDANHLKAFINTNAYIEKAEPLISFNGFQKTLIFKEDDEFIEENNAFSDRYHEFNHLVTLDKKEIESSKGFYEKFIGDKKKHIENPEIYKLKSERMTSSKQKRSDLAEIKRKIHEFQEEKAHFLAQNKTFRVLKKGYKSGVINIDNPENPYTILYRDEFNENKAKIDRKEVFSAKHRKELENFTKTSPKIAFFNKNYENIEVLEPQWTRKLKNNNDFIVKSKDSQQRIFGNNKGDFTKRTWLRSSEQREFNIISFKKD